MGYPRGPECVWRCKGITANALFGLSVNRYRSLLGWRGAAAAVAPPFAVADASDGVRLKDDEIELDNAPAAKKFGLRYLY